MNQNVGVNMNGPPMGGGNNGGGGNNANGRNNKNFDGPNNRNFPNNMGNQVCFFHRFVLSCIASNSVSNHISPVVAGTVGFNTYFNHKNTFAFYLCLMYVL